MFGQWALALLMLGSYWIILYTIGEVICYSIELHILKAIHVKNFTFDFYTFFRHIGTLFFIRVLVFIAYGILLEGVGSFMQSLVPPKVVIMETPIRRILYSPLYQYVHWVAIIVLVITVALSIYNLAKINYENKKLVHYFKDPVAILNSLSLAILVSPLAYSMILST